jgi:hypothetical protein
MGEALQTLRHIQSAPLPREEWRREAQKEGKVLTLILRYIVDTHSLTGVMNHKLLHFQRKVLRLTCSFDLEKRPYSWHQTDV